MKISEHKLKNGIRIIFTHLPGTEMISSNVFIGAGSRNENPKIYGISHFLEHLAFKGTKTFPTTQDFTAAIESVGGAQNAWTSEDHTMYWNMLPKKYLKLSLLSLSEQVSKLILDESEIDKERGTVIEEIKRMQDDPSQLIGSYLNKMLWPGHPLECDILGDIKNIQTLKKKDFLKYIKNNYRANNMVVSIAGSFSEATALSLIAELFSDIQRGPKVLSKGINIKQKHTETKLVHKKLEQGHMILAYHTFGFKNKRKHALDVLMSILAGGQSSILFTEIREKRGLAYAIDGGASYLDDCGFVYIYGGFNKEKIEEALRVIVDIKNQASEAVFEPAIIAKGKEYLKGNILMKLDGIRNTSTRLGQKKLLNPKEIDYHSTIKNIDKVTAKDIQKVAQEIFVPDKENLLILGPYKNKEKFAKILTQKKK